MTCRGAAQLTNINYNASRWLATNISIKFQAYQVSMTRVNFEAQVLVRYKPNNVS